MHGYLLWGGTQENWATPPNGPSHHLKYYLLLKTKDVGGGGGSHRWLLLIELALFAWCSARRMVRCWGFIAEDKFIHKAAKFIHKETGEQVSDLPPRYWEAWDIYGIKKQGGHRHGERWLEIGKGKVNGVLCGHIWVIHFFMGCMFKNAGA